MSNEEILEPEVPKIKLDICHFRVPVLITSDEDGDPVANFKEVEMRNLCFKIQTEEFANTDEIKKLAEKLNHKNRMTLKIASKTKQEGDTITRLVMTEHESVTINKQ